MSGDWVPWFKRRADLTGRSFYGQIGVSSSRRIFRWNIQLRVDRVPMPRYIFVNPGGVGKGPRSENGFSALHLGCLRSGHLLNYIFFDFYNQGSVWKLCFSTNAQSRVASMVMLPLPLALRSPGTTQPMTVWGGCCEGLRPGKGLNLVAGGERQTTFPMKGHVFALQANHTKER